MNLPYDENLPISRFAHIFDNTSECYKFFWFRAILSKVLAATGDTVSISYRELTDEMIASAWYMVSEYHLNLGPRDALEKAVRTAAEHSHLSAAAKKEDILFWLKNTKDMELEDLRNQLIQMVPYRLLQPFTDMRETGGDWKGGKVQVMERLNSYADALYTFDNGRKLSIVITVRRQWVSYFRRNRLVVEGWSDNCLIHYLQKRNPSVPGIVDKIVPPAKRHLKNVSDYYHALLESGAVIRDIYTGEQISKEERISIDHFVPWSYVAHDELWNLNPTVRSINSAKGNSLPDWNAYYPLLARQEYLCLRVIYQNDAAHDAFLRCAKHNLNDSSIMVKLYRSDIAEEEFSARLEELLLPAYLGARTCGFTDGWQYAKKENG